MKKIYINKTEAPAAVIEKIIASEDREVRLYIPRSAAVAQSEHDLSLLKRETENAGKVLVIESVDDDILMLADAVGIQAINPFFGREKKAVADVVLRVQTPAQDSAPQETPQPERVIVENTPPRPEPRFQPIAAAAPALEDNDILRDPLPEKKRFSLKSRSPWTFRRFSMALGATIAVTAIIAATSMLLPRAEVALVFSDMTKEVDASVEVKLDADTASLAGNTITLPGVLLSEKKNITQTFPASDKGYVTRKATGKITIYNAFDTNPQTLVANTRFETPDGKIFRITGQVVVPGGTKTGGTLTPGSVEANVVADEAGESYNIGPVSRFTIPGFKGSPRYEGFYATSTLAMSGGFVGETKKPTATDISAAREAAKAALLESLQTAMGFTVPEDVVIIPEFTDLVITDEQVDENVNESGEFTVTVYGEARAFGFKKEDLSLALLEDVRETEENLEMSEHTITLQEGAVAELADREAHMPAHIKTVWTRAFDVTDFKKQAAKKNKEELKALIFSLPGIKSAEVRLWPFWVRHVPERDAQISVDVTHNL